MKTTKRLSIPKVSMVTLMFVLVCLTTPLVSFKTTKVVDVPLQNPCENNRCYQANFNKASRLDVGQLAAYCATYYLAECYLNNRLYSSAAERNEIIKLKNNAAENVRSLNSNGAFTCNCDANY